MDTSLRVRLIGLGIQLTLVGGLLTLTFGDLGLSLVVVGTFVTGWGVV